MNSLVPTNMEPASAPRSGVATDYCSRALALWPRLERQRLARIRHDPNRVAALVSRRTTLSYVAILELLGAPSERTETPERDH
jgi:hypothetical protein